jgi:Cu/Ag efflux protein CusF
MRASTLALAATLMLAATGVAYAQSGPAMKAMPGMSMSASGMKHGHGAGAIKALNPTGSVTLQHGPIPRCHGRP